jgi:hypothetical protein
MQLVAGFPQRRSEFEPKSCHVGFVVDKVDLGQVSSEYFGFSCQFSLHITHSSSIFQGCYSRQLVADVPSGLSLTPPQEKNVKVKSPGNEPEPLP